MKIIRIIIAIVIFIPLIIAFGWQFGTLWPQIRFAETQLWFWIAFAVSLLLFLIFLKQSAYVSILKHELVHNFFALLTFKKPEGINVSKGKGGEFSYSGKSNPFIMLSPYFFPLITAILLLIFLFGLKNLNIFFLFLGIACAFDMMTAFKDTHLQQTDLKKYGFFFSLLFVMFFWLINWGVIFNFVMNGGFQQIDDYFVEGGEKVLKIFQFLFQFFESLAK